MERGLYRLGRLTVRYRFFVVALWIFLALGAGHVLPSLSSVVSTQNSAFLPASTPSLKAAALAAPFASTRHPTGLLVVDNWSKVLSTNQQHAITELEHRISLLPRVLKARDLATSVNGSARLASVTVNTPFSGDATNQVVASIRSEINRRPLPGGARTSLTGTIAISADTAAADAKSAQLTQLASYLVILLILGIVYRSFLAPLLNLIPAGIALAVAGPLVGRLAQWGLPVSAVTEVMLTVLILGAGTDYGLFVIMRFREELESGTEAGEAVARAVAKVGEAVVFAALTVAAALSCLIVGSFGIYRGLGPSLAVAILVMLLAAMTLLPALLAIAGRWTFFPSKQRVRGEGGWARVAERCALRPGLTLLVGVVFLGGLAIACIGMSTSGFSAGSTAPPRSQSARGLAAIDANFPASVTGPTGIVMRFSKSIWSDPVTLERLRLAELVTDRNHLFASVSGPFSPAPGISLSTALLAKGYAIAGEPALLPPVPPSMISSQLQLAYRVFRAAGQYIAPDGRTVQLSTTLRAGPASSDAAASAVPALRQAADSIAKVAGARASGVTGIATISFDVKQIANQDLLEVFPIVAFVIGFLLALLLRSLVAPAFLLATVALSYFATLGITVLIFDKLGREGGINFVLPFLLFVFLVALGEDYNILVMSRIKEEWPLGSTRAQQMHAVVAAVGATGTTVTSAGIILASTFSVIGITGASIQVKEIGVALAIGILLDTFIVRTLLVPSIVQLLGGATWWPSSLSRGERSVDDQPLIGSVSGR